MFEPDPRIDDLLRQVRLPQQLHASLAPETLFSDAAIDGLVCRVPLPGGLVARTDAAVRGGADGRTTGVVDLSRFVAGPAHHHASRPVRRLLGRLLTPAREAARVAAALGLAAIIASAGIEFSRHLEDRSPAGGAAAARSPGSVRPRWSRPAMEWPAPATSALPGHAARKGDRAEPEPLVAAATAADVEPTPVPGAPERSDEAPVVRGAPVGADDVEGLIAMATVTPPDAARRGVPRAAAFDMAFEMAYGEAPFVDPSAEASLAVDWPPLTLRTDGLDDLLAQASPDRGGRIVARRGRVRVEEVLAAVSPPPTLAAGAGAVRLGLHGVRTSRTVGGRHTLLLEAVALAAGTDRARSQRLPVTLILDQSSAGDPRVWPRVCRGLAAAAGRLGSEDRVTVVLAGPRPRVGVRDAGPATLAAAAGSWEWIPPSASADLDAAIELAETEGLADRRTILVAHALTLDRGRSLVRKALASWHRDRAGWGDRPEDDPDTGPRFVVIDPTTPAPDREAEPTFGRTGFDATAIRRELAQQLTGHDTLAARQCRLEVRFDPRTVAAYRLVGFRQSAVESLAEGPSRPLDLHAGETVRAVYEVVPRSDALMGLATATLTWRAMGGGEGRLTAEDASSIDRGDGLPSPHGCELLLAAGLAELAAGSVHQAQPRQLLAALHRTASQWRDRGDLTGLGAALVGIVDHLEDERRPVR